MKLKRSFYTRDDVVAISRELLGKFLITGINGKLTGGMITEAEAYNGRNDKGCHAYNRRTRRTEVMYGKGGVAYVYLCYGMHHLFNIVTNKVGLADAVLIRAIEPMEGIPLIFSRRNMNRLIPTLTAGPGSLSKALGITTDFYGTDLLGNVIWVEDRKVDIPESEIIASPRIGIDYAEEHVHLPWRFTIKGNKWVSRVGERLC